ncbi:hypothetical protein PPERSA_03781 [Pseudocohnilembus persalinus]|uniref:Uncharacterized protein n=1 Tax=Pseudocohnilembus persalinus TaxID=266149 RepID=A0A0V0R8B7_PSEPJ|nr:hypothetical protein PPERSA_03781 [Pseudocohnilembus persalinus]|eukprot:KRX10723.1 hypothetical protein PPERSA_03781 [Pseudocohnilembus persalinus]
MGQEKPLEGVDYSKFDPKFTNEYEIVGHEFGVLHEKRAAFIAENRGKWVPEPVIPQNVEGLILRTGKTPATRNWYRRTTSFERNGFFNFHTPVFNTKWLPWSFTFFLLYGWVAHQIGGYNNERYEDNLEHRNTLYWKMQVVELPQAKIWLRPG